MFLATCWTVRSQCSCAPCLSRAEVRPCHSSGPWPALVVGSGEIHYRLAVLVFRCRHNMAPPYLARDLCWTVVVVVAVAKSSWTVASLRSDLVWQHLSTRQRVGGRLLSSRIWSSHRLLGRPGRRFHDESGVTTRLDSAEPGELGQCVASWQCVRKWSCSVWQRAGGKPVWFVALMFRTWSCHRMPSIWRWHFMWKLSRIRVSSARRVHVSAAYRSVERTSVVQILMDSDKRRSRHIFFNEAIADEARAMRLLTSDRHGPSGPMRQKRYIVYVPSLANDWSCRERHFTRSIGDRSFRVTVARGHGTVFHLVSVQHLHWDNWKHSCLIALFRY